MAPPDEADDARLLDFHEFLPPHAASSSRQLVAPWFQQIMDYLSTETRPPSYQDVMLGLRECESILGVKHMLSLSQRVSLALAYWKLFVLSLPDGTSYYGYTVRKELLLCLKRDLQKLATEEVLRPAWAGGPTEEQQAELARLRAELDLRVMVRHMVAEINKPRFIAVGTPDCNREKIVGAIMEVLVAWRRLNKPDERVAEVVSQCAACLDEKHLDMVIFARIIVVSLPKEAAQEAIADGRLWTWWSSYKPEGLVPRLDLMWSPILARHAKLSWLGRGHAGADAELQAKLPWIISKAYRTFSLPIISPAAMSLDQAKGVKMAGLERVQLHKDIEHYIFGVKNTAWKGFSRFVAYSLEATPEPCASAGEFLPPVAAGNTWSWLALLIKRIMPYLRPGMAFGEYVYHTICLVTTLVAAYYMRALRERDPRSIVPAEKHLTRAADEALVKLILPMMDALLEMDNPMTMTVCLNVSLQLMRISAMHAPAMPPDMESVDPFTVSVTSMLFKGVEWLNDASQSAKHATALQLLARAVPSLLLRWPALLGEVLPITLLAIDATDMMRTVSSFGLLISIFTEIPCLDVGDWTLPEAFTYKQLPRVRQRWLAPGDLDPSCDEESCPTIMASMLPGFAIDYMQRILEFVSNVPKPSKREKGAHEEQERLARNFLFSVTHLIISQVDNQTYERVLGELTGFLNGRLLVDQSKVVGIVVEAVAAAKPDVAIPFLLKGMMKKLCQTENNAGKPLHTLGVSKTEATWCIKMICSTVRCGGPALLPHRDALEGLIKGALMDETDAVAKLGIKLLRRVLYSLTATYVDSDCRVCNAATWERLMETRHSGAGSAESASWPLRWWGWTATWWANEEASVRYHLATDAEVAWARDLVNGVLSVFVKIMSPAGLNPESKEGHWLDGFERTSDKKPSQRVVIGIKMARGIIRGVAGLWPDERDTEQLKANFVASVSPHENDTGRKIFTTAAGVLCPMLQTMLARESGRGEEVADSLPNGIEAIELPRLMGKTIKCISELLKAPGHVSEIGGTLIERSLRSPSTTNYLVALLRLEKGFAKNAIQRLSGLPRIWWTMIVTDHFDKLMHRRCSIAPYEGLRKTTIDLLADVAINASAAVVRNKAHNVVAHAVQQHRWSKDSLLTQKMLPALAEETQAALKCGALRGEEAEKEQTRINGVFDGIANSLGGLGVLGKSWRTNMELATNIGVAICEAVYAITRNRSEDGPSAASKEGEKRCEIKKSTISNIVGLADKWIDNREALARPSTPEGQAEMQASGEAALKAVASLMDICERSDCHWRAQVIAAAMICALRTVEIPVPESDEARKVWGRWLKFIVKCIDSSTPTSLCLLGVHGLTALMVDPAPLAHSDILASGIYDLGFVTDRLLLVMAPMRHESLLRGSEGGGGGCGDVTEKAVKLIMESKAFRQWPSVWWCSTVPPTFAFLNVLFWERYFGVFAAGPGGAPKLAELVQTIASTLASKPVNEAEHHVCFTEVMAGALRALSTAEASLASCVWQELLPHMRSELQKGSWMRTQEFGYAIYFVVSGYSRPVLERYLRGKDAGPVAQEQNAFVVPFLNFTWDSEDNAAFESPLTSSLTQVCTPNTEGADALAAEGSSFGLLKRLHILGSLVYQEQPARALDEHPDFAQKLFESLQSGIGHPYTQLRDESARLLLRLRRVGLDSSDKLKLVGAAVAPYLVAAAAELLPLLRADGATGAPGEEESKQKEPHVVQALGICSMISQAATARLSFWMLKEAVPQCVDFLIAASAHHDSDLRALASQALALTCMGNASVKGCPTGSEECMISLVGSIVRALGSRGEHALTSKQHEKALSMGLRCVVMNQLFLLCCGSPQGQKTWQDAWALGRENLGHAQHDVRVVARSFLSNLMQVDSAPAIRAELKRCSPLARSLLKKGTAAGCTEPELVAVGVLSSSMLLAADLGAPVWVGLAIECLAPLGHSKVVPHVRSEAQTVIQTFLKSQQSNKQMWSTCQKKLTPSQLDLLNEYKGNLTYFS